MDLDRAEIKCSNKNLKINWFGKRCNIGPVSHIWLIMNLLKNLSVDIEI